jgi:ferredoxin
MKRSIITIDNDKCNGCGACVPGCPEGAIRMIDGKARLVSDLFCDGLGAYLGECPEGAIAIEEREAEPYSERLVMENIAKQGANTINAHLTHLKDHGGPLPSELRQWPVQLKLINPDAPYFKNADLVIAADCTPFAYGNFHREFLKGKALVIMCPKLDQYQEEYVEKLSVLLSNSSLKSLSIVRMEVPCCGGINIYVKKALAKAGKSMTVREYVISTKGEILA